MDDVYYALREIQDVLDAQWNEALTLQGEGCEVPAAWVDTAREAFRKLRESTIEDMTIKHYWEWLLGSILQHLRYYQDADLTWSVIWTGEHAQQTWRNLWRKSRALLNRLQEMSDAEIRAEIRQDQNESLDEAKTSFTLTESLRHQVSERNFSFFGFSERRSCTGNCITCLLLYAKRFLRTTPIFSVYRDHRNG